MPGKRGTQRVMNDPSQNNLKVGFQDSWQQKSSRAYSIGTRQQRGSMTNATDNGLPELRKADDLGPEDPVLTLINKVQMFQIASRKINTMAAARHGEKEEIFTVAKQSHDAKGVSHYFDN